MKLFVCFYIVALAGILQANGQGYFIEEEDDGVEFYDLPLFKREVLPPIIDLIEYYGISYVTLPYRVQTTKGHGLGKPYKIYYFNISQGPKVEICHARVIAGAQYPNVEKVECELFVHPEQTFFAGRSLPQTSQTLAGRSAPKPLRGRNALKSLAGRSAPKPLRGPSALKSLAGRSAPQSMRGRSAPKSSPGRSSPKFFAGRSLPGTAGRSQGTENSNKHVIRVPLTRERP